MKDLFRRPLFLVLLFALLALIGIEIKTLRYSLAQRLISPDNSVRNAALSEVPALPVDKRQKLVSDLLQLQKNAKPQPKRFAMYAIRIIGGKTPDVINGLVSALGDDDPHVRQEAQTSLMEIGESALPSVAEAAKSHNDVQRGGALNVLEKAGSPAVPLLIPMLKDSPARVTPVLEILARLGGLAKPALPAVIDLFKSPDADLRLTAAMTANVIQRPTPEALSVFMQALKERPWDAKSAEIVRAVEEMGAAAKSVAPELTKLMLASKEDFSNGSAARPVLAEALSEIDPRRSEIVDLQFDLKQKNPALRYRAAYALSVMDPPNIAATESLIGAVNDQDEAVAARALVALKRIGLDKTERFGASAQAKIKAAEKRIKAAEIPGFDKVY